MGNKDSAFSLIELLVVITIVGVIAAVAVPAYKTYLIKARVAQFTQQAQSYVATVATYYNQHGVFPDLEQLGITAPDLLANNLAMFSSGLITSAASYPDYTLNDTCDVGGYQSNMAGSDLAGAIIYYYIALPNGTIANYCNSSFFEGISEGAPPISGVMSVCVDSTDNDAFVAWDNEMIDLATSCP